MKIAFLTNIPKSSENSGAGVHVSQVAHNLLQRGHKLYTNLLNETDSFVKLSEEEFFSCGSEINAFYIRLHGSPKNDELTNFRVANLEAPCIWEINSPLEELRMYGVTEDVIQKKNKRRKYLAKMVDAAVCVSREMEEYARNFLEIKKTFVVPNGTDPVMFAPERRECGLYGDSSFTALWAGSPEYSWQGLELAERLAKKLEDVDRRIVVAVTAEGKSTKNLIYLGRVPYSNMPKYIASADVGLCIYKPIDFFGFFYFSPLKLFDYMASGLPVIGSDVGQIKRVIEECKNGLLSDTTIDDLAKKVLYLKENRTEAAEIGMKGRIAAVEKYDWKNVTIKLEQIISEQIVERKLLFIQTEKSGWMHRLNGLEEKVQILAERNKKLAEQLAEKSNQLEEKERYIGSLLVSRSWKITAPLRKIMGVLTKKGPFAKKLKINKGC